MGAQGSVRGRQLRAIGLLGAGALLLALLPSARVPSEPSGVPPKPLHRAAAAPKAAGRGLQTSGAADACLGAPPGVRCCTGSEELGRCVSGACQPLCSTGGACEGGCLCPPETHTCEAGVCQSTFEKPTAFIVGHRNLSAEVAAADEDEGWEVVFFGDSLTERLRGTSMGLQTHIPGIQEVFDQHVASKYRAAALGISGDRTYNLFWRLLHGELPRARHPKAVLLLIGTNDLGLVYYTNEEAGETVVLQEVEPTVHRAEALAKLLLDSLPGTQIALLALLPRGKSAHAQPSVFTEGINRVNEQYRALAGCSPRLHYVDCANPLLLTPAGTINGSLVPDALHPSPAGYETIFSGCWDAAIAGLVANATAVPVE